jgi:hypothetical protein
MAAIELMAVSVHEQANAGGVRITVTSKLRSCA